MLVAMDMASRIGCSPLMAMQSLDIIHGRPGWRASFLIATVNASGKWSPLRFECRGEDASEAGYRCRAWSSDKETGERCEGPWIDWRMVNAEGWASKKGSKWQSMPELMFRYRAAAFWARLYAPEMSLGMHTAEEHADTGARSEPVASAGLLREAETVPAAPASVADLTAQILATPAPAPIGAMSEAERRQVEEAERAESDRAIAAKDAEMDTSGT